MAVDGIANTSAPPRGTDTPENLLTRLGAISGGVSSLVGISTIFFWLIGESYAEIILRRFSISPHLLDRSIQTVSLSGVRVFFEWTSDVAGDVILAIIWLLFVLLGLRIAIALLLPLGRLIPAATKQSLRATWDRVRIPLPTPSSLTLAVLILAIVFAIGSARRIGGMEAEAAVAEIRSLDSDCDEPGACPTYVTDATSVRGVLITADKDKMFISTGHGVTQIATTALRRVEAGRGPDMTFSAPTARMPMPQPVQPPRAMLERPMPAERAP